MRRILPVIALATALCGSPLRAQDATKEDYGLRPGDQVETTLYTANGESLQAVGGARFVDRDGDLFFPFVGTVHVEGLDAAGVRGLLIQRFEPFYKEPVVIVNVKLKVNITGIVGAPGHYLLEPTMTIVDAIAQAGGTGLEFQVANNAPADLTHVRLERDGQAIILNLRPEVADPGPIQMRIQSGDWIYVPPRPRSRLRDDIAFWSGFLSIFTSVAAVVAILTK